MLVNVPMARLVAAAMIMMVGPALAVATTAGCGPSKAGSGAAGASRPALADEPTDGGDGDGAPAEQHPFAGTPAEATQIIGAAVEKRSLEMQKCVDDYRVRKKLPRQRVTIQLGIGQEGRLLGATLSKGKSDPVLSECLQNALADAPFPRSHAGVISITKSYEEIAQ